MESGGVARLIVKFGGKERRQLKAESEGKHVAKSEARPAGQRAAKPVTEADSVGKHAAKSEAKSEADSKHKGIAESGARPRQTPWASSRPSLRPRL